MKMDRQSLIEQLMHTKMCRICFSEDLELQWLFSSSYDDTITFDRMLALISSQEIIEDDDLPQSVCHICLSKIIAAFNLAQQVERSESILKNCIECVSVAINICENSCDDTKSIFIILPEYDNEGKTQINYKEEDAKKRSVESDNFSAIKELIKKEAISENGNYILLLGNRESLYPADEPDKSPIALLEHNDACLNPANTLQSQVIKRHHFRCIEAASDKKKSPFVKTSDYDCTMCPETFSNLEDLRKHRRMHPKGARHFCRICHRSYGRASIMKRHYFTHNGVKDHKCKICGKTFFYLHALRAHTSFHKKKYQCTSCHKRFTFLRNLTEHMAISHPDDATADSKSIESDIKNESDENKSKSEYDCTMCPKSFFTFRRLQIHRTIHPKGTRHKCRACGNTYTAAASLQRHLVTHTGMKPYLCPLCGKSYSLQNSLKSHMLYHSEKTFECELCQKKFHTQYDIKEHIRVAHSDNRYRYMCETCGKLCTSNSRLAVHRESHSLFCCPYCGKTYRNLHTLKTHIQKHEDVPNLKKTYICDYCGETRYLKIFLERHILKKHMRERNFKCDICGKRFFDRNGLVQHGIVHAPRTEQCDICGRQFTNKRSLKFHKNLHTGEKPFNCNICGNVFASNGARLIHRKKNHVEGKYSCKMCPEQFGMASDLYKHMSVHTKCIKIQTALPSLC